MHVRLSLFFLSFFLHLFFSDDKTRGSASSGPPAVVQILTVGKERVVEDRDAPVIVVDDVRGPCPGHLAPAVGLGVCAAGASQWAASVGVLAAAGSLHRVVREASSRGLWRRRRRKLIRKSLFLQREKGLSSSAPLLLKTS